MEEKEERLSLSISIKKSLLLVSDRSIGIRAETYNLGVLLLTWWKVCFMICRCFCLKEGNDMAKETWKVFFLKTQELMLHSKNTFELEHIRVKVPENSRISSG